MIASVDRPLAPAHFLGHQEGFGPIAGFEIWNLTADIPGHSIGSSVSREALVKAGYFVPPAPASAPQPKQPAHLAAYFIQ